MHYMARIHENCLCLAHKWNSRNYNMHSCCLKLQADLENNRQMGENWMYVCEVYNSWRDPSPPCADLRFRGKLLGVLSCLVMPVLWLHFPGAFVRAFVVVHSNFFEDFLQVGLEKGCNSVMHFLHILQVKLGKRRTCSVTLMHRSSLLLHFLQSKYFWFEIL